MAQDTVSQRRRRRKPLCRPECIERVDWVGTRPTRPGPARGQGRLTRTRPKLAARVFGTPTPPPLLISAADCLTGCTGSRYFDPAYPFIYHPAAREIHLNPKTSTAAPTCSVSDQTHRSVKGLLNKSTHFFHSSSSDSSLSAIRSPAF